MPTTAGGDAAANLTTAGAKLRKWQLFGGGGGGVKWGQERSPNLRPEVREEWHEVQDELQRFQQSFDAGTQFLEPATTTTAITTTHWVKNSECNNCSNKSCKRPLWAMSKHHCRKCGNIYCAKCLQFKRRLSHNAEYDPNGWLSKVCERCFDAKEQEMGHSRRWTYDIHLFRKALHKQDNAKLTKEVVVRVCKNLVAGFQANETSGSTAAPTPQPVASSPDAGNGGGLSKNPFSLLKLGVSKVVSQGVPDWQKPETWVSEGTSCQCCNRPYGKLERKHNCRICGRLVCKAQSSKDLLLYTPDKSDRADLGAEPRWAIIKVIGSPELEPDHHMYLRICDPCKENLQGMQIEDCQRQVEAGNQVNTCSQQLMAIYEDVIKVQGKIDSSIPEFQKLIDGLEIQAGAPASLPPNRNNMQLLAKHQGDLSDHLSLFVVTIARLKKLNPQTRVQVKLLKNVIICKFSFYTETNNLYRQLRRQLGEIAPQEVLKEIQSIVDAKAINSACLSLNQLAFECLHLCIKYELDQTLPLSIKKTAEVCEGDLKRKMESSGQNWEEHEQQMSAFVKIQIKGDPENGIKPRQYIRPSRRKTKKEGAVYVEWFVNQRLMEMTEKIRAQLNSRTADRSFKMTKFSLEELRDRFITKEKEGEKEVVRNGYWK